MKEWSVRTNTLEYSYPLLSPSGIIYLRLMGALDAHRLIGFSLLHFYLFIYVIKKHSVALVLVPFRKKTPPKIRNRKQSRNNRIFKTKKGRPFFSILPKTFIVGFIDTKKNGLGMRVLTIKLQHNPYAPHTPHPTHIPLE